MVRNNFHLFSRENLTITAEYFTRSYLNILNPNFVIQSRCCSKVVLQKIWRLDGTISIRINLYNDLKSSYTFINKIPAFLVPTFPLLYISFFNIPDTMRFLFIVILKFIPWCFFFIFFFFVFSKISFNAQNTFFTWMISIIIHQFFSFLDLCSVQFSIFKVLS